MKLDYEIISLGMDHDQYFQGFGVSFTRFDHAVVGIGDTEREAFADALDQIASHCAAFEATNNDGARYANKIEASAKRNGIQFGDTSAFGEAVDQWRSYHSLGDQGHAGDPDDECECEPPDAMGCELAYRIGVRFNLQFTAYGSRMKRRFHSTPGWGNNQ